MKLSINQLKYFKSLQERKYRQKYHNFMVEGVKLALEVLNDKSLQVEAVVAIPDWLEKNRNLLREVETIVPVSDGELKKISLLSTPNQVVLVVKQLPINFDAEAVSGGLSLYLDDIRDPGNLGTILRISDWFGIKWVFCSPGSVEAYNPKVLQAGMGAFLRVNCLEMDFMELRAKIPEIPVYGTLLDGKPIAEAKLEIPAIIAVGNESRGLSEIIQAQVTHRISIPRGIGGGAESLNAAVATGIVCAMFTKNELGNP